MFHDKNVFTELEETLPKYLQSIVPFVNENEYNVTKNLANELVKEGGLGKKLQSLLEQRAKEKENWVCLAPFLPLPIEWIQSHHFSWLIGGWIGPILDTGDLWWCGPAPVQPFQNRLSTPKPSNWTTLHVSWLDLSISSSSWTSTCVALSSKSW